MLCPLDSDAKPGVPVGLVVAVFSCLGCGKYSPELRGFVAKAGSTPAGAVSNYDPKAVGVPVDALATVRHRAVTDTPRSQ